MNTNVKIGIAGAIVAALVALIVLDQKTTPKDGAPPPAADPNAVTLVPSADPAGERVKEGEIDTILKAAESDFNKTLDPRNAPSKGAIKQGEERNQKDIKPVAGDEYVIKEKDSLEKIAKARYGSGRYTTLIVEANPSLKPNQMLKIGQRIVLPPLPAKDPAPVAAVEAPRTETPAEIVKPAEPAKSYTVSQGDSLMSVSQKVFGTARHYKKIYEANKDKISDPNNLLVGIVLSMPELAAAAAGTVATAVVKEAAPAAQPAASGNVHVVAEKESLWKIAEKYAAAKGKGVLAMMDSIVAANPDKLKDKGTPLRLGWQLSIPE